MKRALLLLTVATMLVVMLAVSAPNAFAAKGVGGGYGWGVHDCYTDIYNYGGPGCGYHGQR